MICIVECIAMVIFKTSAYLINFSIFTWLLLNVSEYLNKLLYFAIVK